MNTLLKWIFVYIIFILVAGCSRQWSGDGGISAAVEVVNSFDGVPVRYQVHGEGKLALVLVHGWSCDRSYWAEQLEEFSQKFQVVTVDLVGHGESGHGRKEWTIESFGADVAAVAEDLGLDHMILIGHSMGGDVIMEAARLLPGRVEGLVWIDTYQQLGTPRTFEQIQEILAPFHTHFAETTSRFVRGMFPPGSDKTLVEWVANDMAAAPPDIALEALQSSFTYGREITVPLEELKLPVVAINPDNSATDLESMERHGVQVVLMSGVGHFLMMEDPENFNQILLEVIEGFIQ